MKRFLTAAMYLVPLLVVHGNASAQFFDRLSNPKIQVPLTHPPGLGIKVNRIALGPAKGEKADQVVDAITSVFVSGGLEVLDRDHLQSTMAEHQLNSSGMVDTQTAMQLGKFLGSTALVYVNVQRAASEQHQLYNNYLDFQNHSHVDHIAETQAFLKVSVQTVDLTSGRTLQAKIFEASPKRSNTVTDQYGWPVFPSEYEVLDEAMHEVVAGVFRLFMPWTETREVYFFNDADCQMKTAYTLLKGGDLPGATKQSLDSVETCRADPKMKEKPLAHSLYNVGMTAFLAGDNDKALDYLRQSQQVKDIGITSDAMVQVNAAIKLAAESRAVEARTAEAEDARAAAAPPPPPPPVTTTPVVKGRSGPSTRSVASGTSTSSPTAKSVTLKSAEEDNAKPKGAPAERLKTLNDLLKQGIITKDEYDKKKAEILKEM